MKTLLMKTYLQYFMFYSINKISDAILYLVINFSNIELLITLTQDR